MKCIVIIKEERETLKERDENRKKLKQKNWNDLEKKLESIGKTRGKTFLRVFCAF